MLLVLVSVSFVFADLEVISDPDVVVGDGYLSGFVSISGEAADGSTQTMFIPTDVYNDLEEDGFFANADLLYDTDAGALSYGDQTSFFIDDLTPGHESIRVDYWTRSGPDDWEQHTIIDNDEGVDLFYDEGTGVLSVVSEGEVVASGDISGDADATLSSLATGTDSVLFAGAEGEGDTRVDFSGDGIVIEQGTFSGGKLEEGTKTTETTEDLLIGSRTVTTTITVEGGEEVRDSGEVWDADGELEYTWATEQDGDRVYMSAAGQVVGYSSHDVGDTDYGLVFISHDGKTQGNGLTDEGWERLDEGKPIRSEDINLNREDCVSDTCIAVQEQQQSEIYAGVEHGLGYLGSGQFFSNLLFGDLYIEQGVASWDRFWAGSVVGEEYWESLVCSWQFPDVQDQGVAFIETPAGTIQFVGHIEAEVSSEGPMLCSYNEEELAYTSCPEGLRCVDEVCVDSEEEAVNAEMYKITWGVQAPMDEAFTPYVSEDGVAITYNILIGGPDLQSKNLAEAGVCGDNDPSCVRLYSYQGDSGFPLRLENGEADGATVVEWSTNTDYATVCIAWGKPPVTINYWVAGNQLPKGKYEGMSGGTIVDPVCNEIKLSTRGTVASAAEAGKSKSNQEAGSRDAGSSSVATEQGVTLNDF